MKRILQYSVIACFLLCSANLLRAQVPAGMNYQAVLRNADGQTVADREVAVQLSIIDVNTDTYYFTEQHRVRTSGVGVMNLVIGEGKAVKGAFGDIPWSVSDLWLEVSYDLDGSGAYQVEGATRLLSVPYAFYAEKAGSTVKNNTADGDPTLTGDADYWQTKGNTIDDPERFFGTQNAADLIVKTNSAERLRISAGGNLTVLGQALFNQDVAVGGNAQVAFDLQVDGSTRIGQDLNVQGRTYLYNWTEVHGMFQTFEDGQIGEDLNVGQDFSVGRDAKIKGNTLMDGRLDVIGDVNFESNLHVGNDVDIDNNLNVDNDAHIGRDLDVDRNVNVDQDVHVANNVDIDNNLNVDQDVHVANNVDIDNNLNVEVDVHIGNDLDVDQNVNIDNDLTVVHNAYIQGDMDVDGGGSFFDLLVENNLRVKNDADIDRDLNVDNNLHVGNDVEVDQNVRINNNLHVVNNLDVDTDATIDNNLHVINDTDIDSDLNVDGYATVGLALTVKRDAIIQQDAIVEQDLTVKGNATFENDATFEKDLTVTQDLNVLRHVNVNNDLSVEGKIKANCHLEVNACFSGADSEIEAYPVVVQGGEQGIAVRIVGGATGENNFISFWDDYGIQGRVEGQTATELMNSHEYIWANAMSAAELALKGAMIIACAAQADVGEVVVWGAEGAVQVAKWAEYNANKLSKVGVAFESGSGDYAEWLERVNPADDFQFGEIVGVRGGKISRVTEGADHVMVVSMSPIVLGNMPPAGREQDFEKVAFMGQVPVRVMGKVAVGDYIIASGNHDGFGRAVAPARMRTEDYARIVGVAWEASNSLMGGTVNVAVGINTNDLADRLAQQERALSAMQQQINQLYTALGMTAPNPVADAPLAAAAQPKPASRALVTVGMSKSDINGWLDSQSAALEASMRQSRTELAKQGIDVGRYPETAAIFNDPVAYFKQQNEKGYLAELMSQLGQR